MSYTIDSTPCLDETDWQLIEALQANARQSFTALGNAVSLSRPAVAERVRRLEDLGVITGYRAVIDPRRLGLPHVAFVEVKLSDTRKAALMAFNKAVRAIPEVEQAHMIASSFDYLLKVRTKDIADYREVLGERISALPHVAHTSTHVSMEAVKEDED